MMAWRCLVRLYSSMPNMRVIMLWLTSKKVTLSVLVLIVFLRGCCVRGGWLLGRRLPSLLRIVVVRVGGISSTRSGCRFCRLVGRSIFCWFVSTWLSRFVLPCVAGGPFVGFFPCGVSFDAVAYGAFPLPAVSECPPEQCVFLAEFDDEFAFAFGGSACFP